jgi:TolB-like protein/cytochrome c-type biogenesis protein CcmH/NrfG
MFGSAPVTGETETRILPTDKTVDRPTAPTTVLAANPASGNTQELGKPKSRRGILIALAAVVAVALAASTYLYLSRSRGGAAKNSIAVLPFQNASGDPNLEYLSDGMTESLINSLSQLPNLAVKARSTVFRYKGKEADPQQVGSELNVQAVLSGRVVQRGDDLTLSLELVDAKTGDQLWGGRYGRKVTDLVALQGELARDVANKLRVKLSGADEQKLAKNYTDNAEAYQLYLKGRFHWNRRTNKDRQRAVEYYNQAIAVDPNYALAYAGLAETFPFPLMGNLTNRNPKLREAALKALSLDENLPEARTALGRILAIYDWDFAGAEREFRRAVELNPNDANAHYMYGQLLSILGRREESEAAYRRALEIEPLSLIINVNYGTSLMYARRYDEAIAQLKKTLELDENFFGTHFALALAFQAQGKYAESIEARAKAAEINDNYQEAASMREDFASGGWEGYLRTVSGDREVNNLASYFVATCHAALGEKEKAFEALKKSYENREIPLMLLKVDPRLDLLRSDPRFAELMRKVGLPQ